jgi:hypothetical protein
MNKTIKPIRVVSVTKTLEALNPGESVRILFADAKPSTINTTASRLSGKTFTISLKGQTNATLITRQA